MKLGIFVFIIITVIYLVSSVSGQCNGVVSQLSTTDNNWQSVKYDMDYSGNFNCEWMISTDVGENVELQVQSWDLVWGFDYLRVFDVRYDSSDNEIPNRIVELTGQGTDLTFLSTNGYLKFSISSDYSNQQQVHSTHRNNGFSLRYRQKLIINSEYTGPAINECLYESGSDDTTSSCQNGGTCLTLTSLYSRCNCPSSTSGKRCETSLFCNIELEADIAPKYIQSPNYPNYYNPNEDCYWLITSSDYIELEVVDFDFFNGGSSDQVWLFDSKEENDDNFVAFLRDSEEQNYVGRKFYSTGGFYRIKFFTDISLVSGSIQNARGFRIRYQYRATQGPDVNIGAIIGGVVGGLVMIAVIIIGGVCYFRKR